jgi:hypothetical protein
MPNYDRLYTLDEPVPYKNIKLYPVKVKDYDMFYRCISSLTIEKQSVSDVNIIKMSYLEYLYHSHVDKNEIDYLILFDYLLHLCMRLDENIEIKYQVNNGNKPVFKINEEVFDSADFDEIRSIICDQNCVELADETIQKEIREKMQEAREMKARNSGNKPASFEDTILCLIASTSMNLEQVYDLSLRKFIKLLQRVDAKLHYQIYMTAAMSGMVEFKDKSILRHWMSDLEKENKNSDVLLNFDSVKNKVS